MSTVDQKEILRREYLMMHGKFCKLVVAYEFLLAFKFQAVEGREDEPPQSSSRRPGTAPPSGCDTEPQLFVFFEQLHIEITTGLQPVLMGLHGQRPDQPQTTGLIREDSHYPDAPLDRLIESFQHIRGL
jgi:hypothetical protein